MLDWQLIHFVRLFMDKMDLASINHNSIYLYLKISIILFMKRLGKRIILDKKD